MGTIKFTLQQFVLGIVGVLVAVNTYFFYESKANTLGLAILQAEIVSLNQTVERLESDIATLMHNYNVNNTMVIERVADTETVNAVQDTKIEHLEKRK